MHWSGELRRGGAGFGRVCLGKAWLGYEEKIPVLLLVDVIGIGGYYKAGTVEHVSPDEAIRICPNPKQDKKRSKNMGLILDKEFAQRLEDLITDRTGTE